MGSTEKTGLKERRKEIESSSMENPVKVNDDTDKDSVSARYCSWYGPYHTDNTDNLAAVGTNSAFSTSMTTSMMYYSLVALVILTSGTVPALRSYLITILGP
jgi:hypothetical protein